MNLALRYKDDIQLVNAGRDMYGDLYFMDAVGIKGLFLLGSSEGYQNDTYTIEADAHVYLDHTNYKIIEHAYKLEGEMLKVKNPLGAWDEYKVIRVKVGQRKLLGNEINNVHCWLKRVDVG